MELTTKLSQASERIQILSNAIELNLAIEEEKNELKAWEIFTTCSPVELTLIRQKIFGLICH
ncbi:tail fiber assembly protein [Pectobacterium parvum]|uniref:tail fiber assembly protein n=1 Tax=Pectobacterium parvum TaxID=2778550 RepID=UPI00090798DB|nr:tail fiber assembly protein [Pectobacterium parvum]